SGRGWGVRFLFSAVCIFFTGVIFSLSMLMAQNKFRSEDANLPFYAEMLFTNQVTYNALLAFDLSEFQPDPARLQKIATLAEEDFNQRVDEHYVTDPNDSIGLIYHMWEGQEYTTAGINTTYNKQIFKDAKWVKCSGRFMYTDYAEHIPNIFVFEIKDADGNFKHWKG